MNENENKTDFFRQNFKSKRSHQINKMKVYSHTQPERLEKNFFCSSNFQKKNSSLYHHHHHHRMSKKHENKTKPNEKKIDE